MDVQWNAMEHERRARGLVPSRVVGSRAIVLVVVLVSCGGMLLSGCAPESTAPSPQPEVGGVPLYHRSVPAEWIAVHAPLLYIRWPVARPGRFDLGAERDRLVAWLADGDRRARVARDPRYLDHFHGLTEANGGRRSDRILWLARSISSPGTKPWGDAAADAADPRAYVVRVGETDGPHRELIPVHAENDMVGLADLDLPKCRIRPDRDGAVFVYRVRREAASRWRAFAAAHAGQPIVDVLLGAGVHHVGTGAPVTAPMDAELGGSFRLSATMARELPKWIADVLHEQGRVQWAAESSDIDLVEAVCAKKSVASHEPPFQALALSLVSCGMPFLSDATEMGMTAYFGPDTNIGTEVLDHESVVLHPRCRADLGHLVQCVTGSCPEGFAGELSRVYRLSLRDAAWHAASMARDSKYAPWRRRR